MIAASRASFAGVEHPSVDARLGESGRELLGLGDALRAHEHRLPFAMTLTDLRHHGIHSSPIVEEDALRNVHTLVRQPSLDSAGTK